MDNFSPEQYDRYEAYRRNALPKQGVRRVCNICGQMFLMLLTSHQVVQQALNQQISTPVAQVVAGFAKVFVGEIVEKGSHRA